MTAPGTSGSGDGTAILYTRPGCPLCYTLHRTAARAARRHGLRLQRVDVSLDPDLMERYGNEVPLLRLPGGRVLQGRVPLERVQEAFREAARAGAGVGWRARLRSVLGRPAGGRER